MTVQVFFFLAFSRNKTNKKFNKQKEWPRVDSVKPPLKWVWQHPVHLHYDFWEEQNIQRCRETKNIFQRVISCEAGGIKRNDSPFITFGSVGKKCEVLLVGKRYDSNIHLFFFTSTFNGHEMFLLTISLSRTDDARLTQTKAESGAHFETLAETLCSMPNTFVWRTDRRLDKSLPKQSGQPQATSTRKTRVFGTFWGPTSKLGDLWSVWMENRFFLNAFGRDIIPLLLVCTEEQMARRSCPFKSIASQQPKRARKHRCAEGCTSSRIDNVAWLLPSDTREHWTFQTARCVHLQFGFQFKAYESTIHKYPISKIASVNVYWQKEQSKFCKKKQLEHF